VKEVIMKGFPTEVIFVVLFGIAMLFNFVMQQAARRRQQDEAAQAETLEEEIPEEVWRGEPPAAQPLPAPPRAPAPRRQAEAPALSTTTAASRRAASPARSRLRVARQSLFGDRWDVQEAFVVATILGRCRADEPHDIR
jgi:cell division protein FtsN